MQISELCVALLEIKRHWKLTSPLSEVKPSTRLIKGMNTYDDNENQARLFCSNSSRSYLLRLSCLTSDLDFLNHILLNLWSLLTLASSSCSSWRSSSVKAGAEAEAPTDVTASSPTSGTESGWPWEPGRQKKKKKKEVVFKWMLYSGSGGEFHEVISL